MKLRNWFYKTRRKLLLWLVDREWAADMFWDIDWSEAGAQDSPEEIVDMHYEGEIGDAVEVTTMRAISLPSRKYKVTIISDEYPYYKTELVK